MHYVKYMKPHSSTPLALQTAITHYLQYLQTEENKSKLTVTNYRESLTLLQKMLSVTNVKHLTKETVRDLKQRLREAKSRQGKELSIRTVNHHLTVLRAFLRYLIQEEELDVYPPDRIRRFKEDPRQVKVMTSEEVERLLLGPDTSKKEGKRDRAILELFYSTGLRLTELKGLNRKDVNMKTREMSIRGKRGKIRVVFLSDDAVASLQDWLDARLDHLLPLFIRNPAKAVMAMPPGEEFRLSRISIYSIVKKYAMVAGIVTDPSPHTLRHSFATDLLRNGADLRSVQELLGHQDLSTTQIYTHVTNPQLKEVHKKFHRKSSSA